jgi:hypothetical protein
MFSAMKKKKSPPKISKIFRIHPQIVLSLAKEARRQKKTQTRILETALRDYLKVKHP